MTIDIYLSDYYHTDGCEFCGENGKTHGIVGSLKVDPTEAFKEVVLADMKGVDKMISSQKLLNKLLTKEYLVAKDVQLIRLYNLLTKHPKAEVTIIKR
jgi:hypothetical protein